MLKPLAKFKTKSGKEVEMWEPSPERLSSLLEFVNRLIAEDTFLSLTGPPKTLSEEETWLKNIINNIRAGRTYAIWAIHSNKIIGSSDINRGDTRDWHVGKIGLMVDRDFRQDGIGKFLLGSILKQAKKMGLQKVILDLFSDNKIALSLYQKIGFKEYARLPKGFYRKGEYSDALKMYKNIL